jgi:hypothetical protein
MFVYTELFEVSELAGLHKYFEDFCFCHFSHSPSRWLNFAFLHLFQKGEFMNSLPPHLEQVIYCTTGGLGNGFSDCFMGCVIVLDIYDF